MERGFDEPKHAPNEGEMQHCLNRWMENRQILQSQFFLCTGKVVNQL